MKTRTTIKKTKSRTLLETTYGEATPLRVDREKGVIYGVKALGNTSVNGGTYSDKAKADVARLLEGTKSFIDHPDRKNPNATRQMGEWAAVAHGAEARPDGVYVQELRILKSHPMAEMLFEAAERFPDKFGLSINADASHPISADPSGKYVVEGVASVRSLDIVGRPATTGGLFESVNEPGTKEKPVRKTLKVTIRGLMESAKANARKMSRFKLAHLMEMEGGDAAVATTPVDVAAPPMMDDGSGDADDDQDPDEQVMEAFQALVAQMMEDGTMSADDMKARFGEIIDAMFALQNGTAPTPDATPDTSTSSDSTPDASGGNPVTESKKPDPIAELRQLMESTAKKQAQQDARFLLMENGREVKADRIKALAEAKDAAHQNLLLESWPKIEAKPAVAKPRSGSALLEQQNDAPKQLRGKELFSALRG